MSCLNWRSGLALGLNQFLCERLPEGDNNVGFQSCLLGTSVRRQWLQPISLPHISTWGTMDQNVILMRTKFCFWIGEIMNEFLKFNPIDWWIGSDPGYHPITYNGTDLNGRLNLCLLATRPNVASSNQPEEIFCVILDQTELVIHARFCAILVDHYSSSPFDDVFLDLNVEI